MTSQAIHFGTSGWRGVIADDFNFSGVRRAAAAIAGHVCAHKKSPLLVVAHDTRFLAEEFALTTARVLKENSSRVLVCQEATPTPAVAHAIIDRKLDGGINVTASHNPAEYNGLKFSGPDGGPALPDVTKDIERRAATIKDDSSSPHEIVDDFERIDPRGPFFAQLADLVRFDVLQKEKRS